MGKLGSLASCAFSGALIGVTLLACGGDDDDALVGTSPITDQTAQALAEVFCQKATECTSELIVQVGYGSVAACQARFKAQVQLDVRSSGYDTTDGEANECLNALRGAACSEVLDNTFPAACRFDGTLADGSNCSSDGQCTSRSCFIADTAACGKCGPRAALGADCTNAQCDYGLRCNATKLCTNGAVGAACARDSDCRTFTTCRGGVCTAPLAEGAACVVRPGDTDPPCDITKALFCFPAQVGEANGTCTKVTVSFAANAEKCGLESLTPPAAKICTNGDCINDACVARLADGAPCTATDGQPRCQEPAKCRAGTCSLKDPTACSP